MNTELPPTFVYPDDFGTSRGSGRGLPNPAPMAMIGKMIQERNSAYARGHWPQMLQHHLKAMVNNRPIRYGLDGIIIGELKVAHGADLVMLRNSTLNTADAWSLGIKEGAKIKNTDQLNRNSRVGSLLPSKRLVIGFWGRASLSASGWIELVSALRQAKFQI